MYIFALSKSDNHHDNWRWHTRCCYPGRFFSFCCCKCWWNPQKERHWKKNLLTTTVFLGFSYPQMYMNFGGWILFSEEKLTGAQTISCAPKRISLVVEVIQLSSCCLIDSTPDTDDSNYVPEASESEWILILPISNDYITQLPFQSSSFLSSSSWADKNWLLLSSFFVSSSCCRTDRAIASMQQRRRPLAGT